MTPTPETKPLVATPLSGEGMDRHRALIGLKGIARLLAEIVHARAGGPSVPTEEIKHGIARLKEAHDTLSALSAEPLQQSDQGGGTPARYPEGTTLAEALDAADLLAGYPDDDEADGPLGRLFITLRHEIRALSPSGSPCRNGEATRSDAPAGARSAPVQPTSSNPDTGGAK